ncbi:MAG: phage/plasmid primase, P4 family, partial [Candidatus Omnitrophota bacterium]
RVRRRGRQLTNRGCTDAANGERLVRAFGQDTRFAFHRKKWFVWDGRRWALDETAVIERYATRVARDILREAADVGSAEEQKALTNWARQSQMGPRIDAMIKAARPLVPLKADETDRDPALLNAANGTIDLRTGELRPHERSDFITKVLPIPYDPTAEAPRWLEFLRQITGGSDQLIGYLQRMAGYVATGETREQCLFLLHGSGANGKSTFIEALLSTLGGDFARPTDFRTLLYRDRGDGVRNDLAALHSVRLVTAVEVAPERRLDEALVKQLTGGDTITARFLYGEYFDFTPKFKLLLAANHRPVIRGVDEGIWRRIRLVPFEVTIPPKLRDRKLPAVLLTELPGILAWIVAGAMAWYDTGLCEPEEVTRATTSYREESDALADFLEACAEIGADVALPVAMLYFAYEGWVAESGNDPWKKDTFAKAIAARGHVSEPKRVNGKTQRVYPKLLLSPEGRRLAAETRRRRDIHDDPNSSF